jgi:hypothetical protein
MTTYIKTSITWSKASKEQVLENADILSVIAEKKGSMIADEKMFDELEIIETDSTVKQINKFSDTTSANEWLSFINSIATDNELTIVSSRIITVTKP